MMGGVSLHRHLHKLFKLLCLFSQSFLEFPKIVSLEKVFSVLCLTSFTSLNNCILV